MIERHQQRGHGEGVPVALTAVGGGPRHALVVEHSVRPLFAFFTALTLPVAVYASDAEFTAIEDDRGYALTNPAVAERLDQTARQFAILVTSRGRSAPAPARIPASALRSHLL